MGCGSTHTLPEEALLKPMTLSLVLPKTSSRSLNHAFAILRSITKFRNRFLLIYHKLLYTTGACVFINPTIILCVHCVFYKISGELGGSLEKANLTYIEDPPYLQMDLSLLTNETKEILLSLFDFITEIRSYKALIKQIDKDTPELLYILFENRQNIEEENINKINLGVDMFKQIIKFRFNLLQQYKNEVYSYITKNEMYCQEINKIGKVAFQKNITNIYQIALLSGQPEFCDKKNKKIYETYSNEEQAKRQILEIMKNDIDDGGYSNNEKDK